MRVFVTGGTGYLGRALVNALITSGHSVSGLVRSEDAAATLASLGGAPVLGDLLDPESYRAAAGEHDAIVHLALAGEDAETADRVATDALLAAAGAGRVVSLVYTSGIWVLGDTGEAPASEEASTARPAGLVAWRPAHERRVLAAAGDRLATAVIRPGLVYGEKGGLLSGLFQAARNDGAAPYVGSGRNRWSMIHRDDLAELYRRVAERRGRGVFHGVDGTPLRSRDVARAASRAAGAGGEVRGLALEEARARFGPAADALALDQAAVAPRSGGLGWSPEQESFEEGAPAAFGAWKRPETEPSFERKHTPHWDIGRPQRAVVRLIEEGRLCGEVLHVGCGSGESALYLAARGGRVLGVDLDSHAIERAREKAEERGLDVEFSVEDVFDLQQLGRRYDAVLDSVVFHLFRGEDRRRYVKILGAIVRPGGRYFALCVREPGPGLGASWRVTAQEIEEAFRHGWELETLEEDRFEHFPSTAGSPALVATLRRR